MLDFLVAHLFSLIDIKLCFWAEEYEMNQALVNLHENSKVPMTPPLSCINAPEFKFMLHSSSSCGKNTLSFESDSCFSTPRRKLEDMWIKSQARSAQKRRGGKGKTCTSRTVTILLSGFPWEMWYSFLVGFLSVAWSIIHQSGTASHFFLCFVLKTKNLSLISFLIQILLVGINQIKKMTPNKWHWHATSCHPPWISWVSLTAPVLTLCGNTGI